MSEARPIIDGLWNHAVSPEAYGDKKQYYDHILEQYKVYVEMADRVSARRNLANTFFLTLHTLIFGAASFVYEKGPKVQDRLLNILPLVVALALCYVWWRLLRSYRQLNSAKFQVIGEYERKLPSSPFWTAEWIEGLGEGKKPELYQPLTSIEYWIPVLFAILYILATLAIVLL